MHIQAVLSDAAQLWFWKSNHGLRGEKLKLHLKILKRIWNDPKEDPK